MLRAYSAVHGLAATHHAVVEVSADTILLRVDQRWLHFTASEMTTSTGDTQPFALNEDGTVTLAGHTDEMDLTAERLARTLLLP